MAAVYFAGKKAIITGAGDGIGRALAQQLNAVGCELWLCDIDSDRLDATVGTLDELKAAVHTHLVDCGNHDAIVDWGRVVAAEPAVSMLFLTTRASPMVHLLPTLAKKAFSG